MYANSSEVIIVKLRNQECIRKISLVTLEFTNWIQGMRKEAPLRFN